MLTRIIVAVVLAPFFFWVLLAPPTFCLALLLSGICALASYELLKATRVAHHNLMYVFTALAAVVVPLGYWQPGHPGCGPDADERPVLCGHPSI